MTSDDIRARIREQPFVPFRMFLSDGSFYDVFHHDFAFVTGTYVRVAVDLQSSDEMPYKSVDIDPHHVTRIQALSDLPNGRARRRRKRRA